METISRLKSLIEDYKIRKQECFDELEQLYTINDTFLSQEEKNALDLAKIKINQEYSFRALIIEELKDLLDE